MIADNSNTWVSFSITLIIVFIKHTIVLNLFRNYKLFSEKRRNLL